MRNEPQRTTVETIRRIVVSPGGMLGIAMKPLSPTYGLFVASVGFDRCTAQGEPGMSLHRAASAIGASEEELIAFAEQEEKRTGVKILHTSGHYLN